MSDDRGTTCGKCGAPLYGKVARCAQCGASVSSVSLSTQVEILLLAAGVVALGLGGLCAVVWADMPETDPGWAGIERLPYEMMLGGAIVVGLVLLYWRSRRVANTSGTPRRRF